MTNHLLSASKKPTGVPLPATPATNSPGPKVGQPIAADAAYLRWRKLLALAYFQVLPTPPPHGPRYRRSGKSAEWNQREPARENEVIVPDRFKGTTPMEREIIRKLGFQIQQNLLKAGIRRNPEPENKTPPPVAQPDAAKAANP